jgi:hypothetical protein
VLVAWGSLADDLGKLILGLCALGVEPILSGHKAWIALRTKVRQFLQPKEAEMDEPETTPEDEITEEETDAEEATTEPAPVAELDKEALLAEAQRRCDKIEARGKDPAVTYAGYVVGLLEGADDATDAALRAEAENRLNTKLIGSSEIYRRHSLAGKVSDGKFNV